MKNNVAYLPADAIARHEDFDVWYADGELFLSVKGKWEREKDDVVVFGRMGGQMGRVHPDSKTLSYYLQIERWEYAFRTYRIFQDYFVDGMHWQINGSLGKLPLTFVHDENDQKEVTVRRVNFRNHGECLEVRCRDVTKLRIAVFSVIAMGVKEEYRGLSEGINDPNAPRLERVKNWFFSGRGKTYEQLLEDEAKAAARRA